MTPVKKAKFNLIEKQRYIICILKTMEQSCNHLWNLTAECGLRESCQNHFHPRVFMYVPAKGSCYGEE